MIQLLYLIYPFILPSGFPLFFNQFINLLIIVYNLLQFLSNIIRKIMPRISNPQNFKGENLISKEALGLKSDEVLIVSGKTADNTVVAPEFLPEIVFNDKGSEKTLSMLPTIKFIGDCNVRQDPTTGELIIRIGENLNSSTFNTKDGQTDGSVTLTDSSTTYPATRITPAGSKTVWLLSGTSNYATIAPAGKIHFDNKTTTFKLEIKQNDVISSYVCGPITGNGTYQDTNKVCTASITNWSTEAKSAQGATGYEATVSIKVDFNALVSADCQVALSAICSGTAGAAEFSKDIAYFLTDTETMPSASLVSAKFASAPVTQTIAGITYVKSGTVNYYVNVASLNNPATDQTNGASIAFDNTSNYAADIAKYSQTVYDGVVNKSATFTASSTGAKYTSFNLKATAYNILSSAVVTTNELYDNNGNKITAIDTYSGTPLAGITTNRVTLASTTKTNKVAYITSGVPGTNDLMIYHNALQYPSAFINNTYYGNSSYVAPSTTGDKEALFWFAATGTENNGLITIEGSNLTDSTVKSITFGNSVANLKNLSGYDNQGSTSAATKLVYKFAYNSVADKATGDTGIFVKVVFGEGSKAKITNITKATF
jgi:hypothetical protein